MSKKRRARSSAPSHANAPGRAAGRTRQPQPRGATARAQRWLRRHVRRRPLVIALALVALHVALALLTFEPQPHTGGDNAAYITLGQSLLEHGTYTELWDPAAPPHTKYPPVFPAVLALAMALGLTPWVQLKLVVLAFSASAVAFSFLWMRARRRPLMALGVGLLLAIAPGVLREGRWILSDVPFWAFSLLALWAFERLRPDDWRRFAIAAAATLLAYFTRSAGLPLLLAALAWLAWRRHWKQLAVLSVITLVPALLWWLRSRSFGPAGYVSEFWLINPYAPELGRIGAGDLVQRVFENIGRYVTIHLPVLMTGAAESAQFRLLSALIFLLGAAGWALRVRRARVADLFLPLYFGLLCIWPAVWSGERFLLPALPLLLFYAGEMLVRGARRITPPAAFWAGAAAVALLVLTTLPGLALGTRIGRACTAQYLAGNRYPCLGDPAWQDWFATTEMTGRALPADAVVLSRKPRLHYAISGLPSRIFPFTDEPAAFFAAADSAGARYVVLDRLGAVSQRYLLPVIARRPAAFCLMTVVGQSSTALLGIMPDAAAVPDLGPDAATAQIGFSPCGAGYWRNAQMRQLYGGL